MANMPFARSRKTMTRIAKTTLLKGCSPFEAVPNGASDCEIDRDLADFLRLYNITDRSKTQGKNPYRGLAVLATF
jgi:hypothetical protein